MLDLFYIALGCAVLLVFWAFTRACDKLVGGDHGLRHCRHRIARAVCLSDLRPAPAGAVLRGER